MGTLQEALRPFTDSVSVAFVFGSIARGEQTSGSAVDLLLVGPVKSFDVAGPLRRAGELLGRAVNSTAYASNEFTRRVADRNHCLTSILDKPRLFVVGSEHELADIARPKARGARSDKRARARETLGTRATKRGGQKARIASRTWTTAAASAISCRTTWRDW